MHQRFNLRKKLANKFRPEPIETVQGALEMWFRSPAGHYLLEKERKHIAKLPKLPGYQIMELGLSPKFGLLDEFDHLHRFSITPASGRGGSAVSNFEELPLPSDIVDCAVLHHALEFSPKPHRVLNEAARVVAPGGHLVLFVFNPFSLLGVTKWPGWSFSDYPLFRHHGLRVGRLVDWLRLLHFKTIDVKRGGLGPIKDDSFSICQRWGYGLGLPFGLYYTIVARKNVARPITRNGLIPNGLKIPNLGWQKMGCELTAHGDKYQDESLRETVEIR
ncbi:methyltransferase domain-containing protein [Porticoccaceae bacterium LTM1]|nr:methyltransferase domain-containing protein [Porticoccaceae bacterium LTM1]